ncbi:uncharacterized protein LOC143879729 [Tasmannia lanceolata]|uniref:uncharacterized protein LOC143879729 n=1 Tax=Tasmannia lanceolata TaxID=3420 RepID=UPI0040632C4D
MLKFQKLMAAKIKEGANGKEKSGLSPKSPPHIDVPHVRRTPKSSVPGSLDRDNSILSEKPTPNYLKPTRSSLQESCKYGKKQASEGASIKRLPHGKSLDKPPSPSLLNKTPVSANPKEKPLKASSPSSKPTISPKFVERKPKILKNGKAQPFTKPKTLKKETSRWKKKETKAATSSDVTEKPVITSDDKEKNELVHEDMPETEKVDGEEQVPLEIPPIQDQKPMESMDSEPKTSENEKPEVDTFSLLEEEHELASVKDDVDNTKDNSNAHETPCKDEEKGTINEENDNGENAQQTEESLLVQSNKGIDGEQKEEGTDEKTRIDIAKTASMDSNDEDRAGKLKFQQGKEIEIKEEDNHGNERLKFKEREESKSIEEQQPEQENVALKRQQVKGKKESPAYNDVIEETASKLVEKKKGKVLALAGAFETVISLQTPEDKGQSSPTSES